MLDRQINAGIPAYERLLRKNHTGYQLFMYEGINQAFTMPLLPTAQ